MNATATLEKTAARTALQKETVIRFDEGLIGFSDCKTFVLMENDNIAPFKMLQSTDKPSVGFLVIEPSLVVKDYQELIPGREWESLGLDDPAAKLSFVICIIGPSIAESSGNFQAPIIINYKKMAGRQLILTDIGLSVRQPLL